VHGAGADNLRIVLMYLNEKKVLDELTYFPRSSTTSTAAQDDNELGHLDTPRAPMHLIRKVYEDGVAAGGDKAGINDTFGLLRPRDALSDRVIREIFRTRCR